jgi:hypothetical protein
MGVCKTAKNTKISMIVRIFTVALSVRCETDDNAT